jgi:hypothetical protein
MIDSLFELAGKGHWPRVLVAASDSTLPLHLPVQEQILPLRVATGIHSRSLPTGERQVAQINVSDPSAS